MKLQEIINNEENSIKTVSEEHHFKIDSFLIKFHFKIYVISFHLRNW